MNYPRALFILGILIILVPFLGIPLLWKHIVTVVLGILVIGFTILWRSSIRLRSSNASVRSKTAPARSISERNTRTPRTTRRLAEIHTVQNASSSTAGVVTSESLIDHDEA